MTNKDVQTPAWVRDAVFYQIFPDRFAKSSKLLKPHNLEPWNSPPTSYGFKGGDLIGVVEHLDYLRDLGINAIYFCPVFQSAANHRYHTYDYHNVDPLLGGNKALRTLVDEAHAAGIRVILDGVFNHASRGFFQFHDIMENGPFSPYIDWFTVNGWPLNAYDTQNPPNYKAWWQLHALPTFNTDNPDVRSYIFDVAERWIDFGIDGWRLDVPGEINDDAFWQEFRRRVKSANPDAYIVGEIWHDATRWLQGDQFDAVMNYLFTKLCLEFFVGNEVNPLMLQGSTLWPINPLTGRQFSQEVEALLHLYHPNVTQVQFNLLGSHDTARYLTTARDDESALLLSTLFQMIYPGTPCVYYGDEIGMKGGKDPLCRASFPWDPNEWNTNIRDYVKQAIALRHAHPALRTGEYITLYGSDNIYAVGRSQEDDKLVVTFNTGQMPEEVTIPVGELLPDGAILTDVWKGHRYPVKDGMVNTALLPRSALVLAIDP
jgi:glycosidase